MNVIMIIADTLSWEHMGCYGNPWIHTPNIDALAGESVRFTRCYAEGLPTIQARRTLWTGCRTFPFHDHVVMPGSTLNLQPGWMPIRDDRLTLSERLLDEGFYTALVSDCPQFLLSSMNFQRGFHEFWPIPRNELRAPDFAFSREQDHFCARLFGAASAWLDAPRRDKEPFLLVVDSFDPHEPWNAPAAYEDMYSHDQITGYPPMPDRFLVGGKPLARETAISKRLQYAAMVTMVDVWLGHFLEKLRNSPVLQNSLLVFISDHGTSAGSHGYIAKGAHCIWDEIVRVPMMIRFPDGAHAGECVDALCYNMDLPATILSFLDLPPLPGAPSLDLLPVIEGRTDFLRQTLTSGYNQYVWVRDEEWSYTTDLERSEEHLYRLEQDRHEQHDLAATHPEQVEIMRAKLAEEAGGWPHEDLVPWPSRPEHLARFPQVRQKSL